MGRAEVDAYIGLGANLGDRLAALNGAVRAMAGWPGTKVVAVSPVYETEAHILPGSDPQPDHLNAVVLLRTTRTPHDLLNCLRDAERSAGRDSDVAPWSPRPLDLDLLIYGSTCIETDELVVPHPRMSERRFVLQPLADLAPEIIPPGAARSVEDLLRHTSDSSRIERTDYSLVPGDM